MLLERQLPFVNDLNSFFYNNSHLGLWAILGLMTLLTVIAFIAKMNMREMAGRLYKHSGRTTLYIIIAAFLFLWLLDILYEISTWYARPGQETVLSGVIRNLGRTISFVVFFSVVLLLFWSIKSLVAARKASFKTRMMWSAAFVWCCGFILYFIGFYGEGTKDSPAALIIRPAISSVELFVSAIDLLEVGEKYKENPVYMGSFAVTSFMALLVSATVVVHFLGISVRSWLKMKSMATEGEDLYIFWGINEPSVILAKDIQEKSAITDPRDGFRANVIFVDNAGEEHDNDGGRMSLGHIMNSFFVRRKSYREIKEAGRDVCLCLSEHDMTEIPELPGNGTLEKLKNCGLEDLSRAIGAANAVHIFFLSGNEDENIKRAIAAKELFSDKNRRTGISCPDTDIYCHACMEKFNYSEIFRRPEGETIIRLFDSAMLAVNRLKSDPELLPVNFVKPDTQSGVATKPFVAAIIGFGETGMEALKFLYEFSAFEGRIPDGNGGYNDGQNPFKCYIFDPNADARKEYLYMKAPALKDSVEIEFIKATDMTAGFWDKINRIIPSLDYAIVSVGDDDTGISIGADIYECALRLKKPESRFQVLVRSYDAGNTPAAQRISEHYRHIDKRYANWDFTLFGTQQELFTKDNVTGDKDLKNAMLFYHEYKISSSGTTVQGHTAVSAETEWNERERKLLNGSLDNYNKLMLDEQQDISNSLHIETKMRLAGITDDKSTILQELLSVIGSRKPQSSDYPAASSQQKILLENLAKCEHLRWNASCRLLGYTTYETTPEEGNKKDYICKRLSCLINNERLRQIPALAETIRYDCNVVDVSLRLRAKGMTASH